ncbi:MAG: hypothetical protein II794_00955 [Oscillospiraceae bacterium]|nr:hypothetical protein [Oscillospiraceae bacterium]
MTDDRRRDRRIYRTGHPWRTALIVLAVLVVAAVLIFWGIVASFRKYIVYTDDGVKLEVPWLQRETETVIEE